MLLTKQMFRAAKEFFCSTRTRQLFASAPSYYLSIDILERAGCVSKAWRVAWDDRRYGITLGCRKRERNVKTERGSRKEREQRGKMR